MVNETDVVCVAQNDALLDGLLTVFHVERSRWGRGLVLRPWGGREGQGGAGEQELEAAHRAPRPAPSNPPLPPSDSLENMQNDQPLLSDYDKECLISLGQVGSSHPRGVGGRGTWDKECLVSLGQVGGKGGVGKFAPGPRKGPGRGSGHPLTSL